MPTKNTPPAPPVSDRAQEAQEYYQAAFDNLSPQRSTWDELERFHFSKTQTKLQSQGVIVSSVDDARLSTLNFERAARIMAQLPTGKFNARTKADRGKTALMQTVWDNYIIPNANAQFDLLTKLRLVEVYSSVYGSQPVIYDWNITDSYVGPDFWLVPIRNFLPQPGKTSIRDSDWCMITTTRSVRWLKSRMGMKGWNSTNIKYLEAVASELNKNSSSRDSGHQSFVERNRTSGASSGKGEASLVELVTLYEAGKKGKWITFCPDFGWVEVCEQDNPHQDGQIPVELKHCFPLLDSMIGLGDYERGLTLQKSRMSLLNMYLDTVKMGLYPPLILDKSKIDVPSSIQWAPAAKWLTSSPNAVTPLATSPQGLQTFQETWNTLTSSLLNLHGTTDTSISQSTDAAYGRTPQALQQQASREGARDNWDRFHMEQFVECLGENLANLFATRQEVGVDIPGIFKDEVIKLREAYPDEDVEGWVRPKSYPKVTMYDSEEQGSVHIPASSLKGTTYKFSIDASSSTKKADGEEFQSLQMLFETMVKVWPVLGPAMEQEGKTVDFSEFVKRMFITASIDDYEKILVDIPGADGNTQGGVPALPGITAPGPQAGQPIPPMQAQNNFTDPDVAKVASQLFGGQP